MKTAALIDIDGVINHATRFSERYAQKYGVDLEVLTPFFKVPFQDCLIGEKDLKEILPQYLDEWHWQGSVDELLGFWFAGEVGPDSDVVAALHQLHAKGIKLIGASNQEKYRMAYLKEALKLDEYFQDLFSSADLGYKKPDPLFYKEILDETGLNPDSLVYWDDDLENVVEARNQGIKAYRFTDKSLFFEQINREFY